MIKIINANNIFGIRSLNGANALDKLNVIYAPNGTAKTSIADAIKNLSIGQPVNDVLGSGTTPTFQFDIDGTVYNESNIVPFTVIKYCGVEDFNLNDSEDYSNLVISSSAKTALSSSISSINNSLDRIDNILLSCFSKKGKGKGQKFSNGLLDSLSIIAGNSSNITLDFALNFKSSLIPLSEKLTEEEVLTLCSTKGKDVVEKPEISSNIASYSLIVSKIIDGKIIDSTFDINHLNDFKKHIIDDLYFDNGGKRQLYINNTSIDKDQFLKFVDDDNASVYGTPEAKKKLDECRETMNKNAAYSKFSTLLLSKPSLIKHSLDYVTFVNEIFVTFLGLANVKLIENEVINIKKERANLSKLQSSLSVKDNPIYDIWEKFKSRFKFKKYDLDIKNKFDAITGNELPRFIKCLPGTKTEIKNPASFRFSTGEIRNFNLINFIIEVERNLLVGQPFTIILDDAVDSFDYKNKYGIIDYLIDIKDNPLIQIIVLTHNFDFYRSSILSFGKGNTNQYFMYKDDNSDVTLYDVKSNKYYLSVTEFNNWKQSGDKIKYISFIPFLRNILQLQTKATDPSVLDTDKYLHYEIGISETLNFTKIEPLMNGARFALPSTINVSDLFVDKLDSLALSISTRVIRETDLEYKILLGLYIRVFLERFLSKRIEIRSGVAPSITDNFARTITLFKQASDAGYLSEEESLICIEANIVSPSYAHANSFMYEPLIDVDSTTLVELSKKIRKLNGSI